MYRFAWGSVHRCPGCESAENRYWAGDVDGNGATLITPGWARQEDQEASREGEIGSRRLLAGFSQHDRAQVIVGLVSQRALHAAAGLMLKALLPQPAAVAVGAELVEGEVTQHGYAPEFVGAGGRRVGAKLAIGNSCESGLACHLQRTLVVTSSGAGEVFDGMSDDFFDVELGIHNFAFQFWFRKIGEVRVGHRMAADLETLRVQIAHLTGIEVTGRAQESSREVEGGVEAELAEHGRGGDQVGLATIVKGKAHARFSRIEKRLADA